MATRLLLVTLLLVVTDYTVANAATQLYDQLFNQLCNGQIDNHYSPTSSSPPPINQGPPGKKGPKGDKGESSTFYVNEEKNRRFASKIATLHKQLTTVQVENQHLQLQLNETENKFKNENEVLSTKLEKTEQLLNSTEQKLSIENQHLQLQLNETEKKFKNENEVLSTKLEKTEQLLNSTEQKLSTVEKLFEEYQRTTESRFSELTERLGVIGVRSCQDVPAFYGTTNSGTYLIQPNPWVPSVNVHCYFNESTGEMITLLASCAEIARIQGTTHDGTYSITPDPSLPPFDVECTFNGNAVTTSVGHNSEMEIEMSECAGSKCYGRNIVYDATIPQIRALISLGGSCRQYIKFRCFESEMNLHNSDSGWESWDGSFRNYWGGSGGRDGYCACGVTGTCANMGKSTKCNCAANDKVWRADEGYLEMNEHLPVTKLYFQDNNDDHEHGLHTLGKLECVE